jgi:hypothetical protein
MIITATNAEFIEENGLTEELIEMYISFAELMTLDEIELLLAFGDGDVQIATLWSGDVAVDIEAVQASSMFFNGVRVLANGGLYSELKSLSAFNLIELGGLSQIDDTNFVPVTIGENTVITLPAPDTAATAEQGDPETPAEAPDPFELPPDGEVNVPDNSDEPDPVHPNPADPLVIPDDNGFIELDITGAADVRFINGNRFVVTTGSQVLLYEIMTDANNNHTLTALSGFVTMNPQIVYIDAATGTLLITGGDAFGRVTNLFIAEGESGELRQLDTSAIMQAHEEIRTALFKSGEVVLRTRGDSVNGIYTAGRNGGFTLNKAVETDDTLVILGFEHGGFKYAQIADGVTRIFRYNTVGFSAEEIDLGFSALEGTLRFMRSNDGSNFAVITDNGTYIWNAALGRLADDAIDAFDVRFHRHSASIISDDRGNWYVLQGTALLSVTEEEAEAMVRKPVFSSTYRLSELTPATVKIEIIS